MLVDPRKGVGKPCSDDSTRTGLVASPWRYSNAIDICISDDFIPAAREAR